MKKLVLNSHWLALTFVMGLVASSDVWSSPEETAASIRALNHKGETKAALEELNTIKGDAPWIQLLNAETDWHAGRFALARNHIDTISKTDLASWIAAQQLLIQIEYLEGNIEASQNAALTLLEDSPEDPIANWFLVTCYLRTGANEKAFDWTKRSLVMDENSIAYVALHADVLDAMGKFEEAKSIRESVIPMLNDASNLNVHELVAGSRALRAMSAYQAANQCIQLAQDLDITDPFMKLEKIRLYRATQGYGVAEKSVSEMVELYTSFPIGYAEWAEIQWNMKVKEEDVVALCKKALDGDPTLLDARCRLIFYALLKDNREECETLIARNFDVNKTHRPTQYLQRAMQLVTGDDRDEKAIDGDPAFASLMTKLLTAKNDYKEGLKWATAHVEAEPESGEALHNLGLAKFRTGSYVESRSLLEQSLATLPYALQTKNLLTFIDGVVENEETESQSLRVAYPANQLPLARFAEARGAQILQGPKLFDMSLNSPLRIQLCTNLNDLPVITEGIPFGCCVDPAHPALTGVVQFEDTVFLWTPEATQGSWPNYRLDEALHKGVVQALVRSATRNQSPLWLEEGIAGYAIWNETWEWAPPNLAMVVGALHSGMKLPIADLSEGYLGSRRPYYQVYAPLLIQEWTQRYGEASIQELLSKIGNGELWSSALENTFGKSMDVIDSESRASILTKYFTLAKSHDEAIIEARSLLKAGNTEEAAEIVKKAFLKNPFEQRSKSLQLDLLEAMSADGEKTDAYYQLLEATVIVNRSDADLRFQLAKWNHSKGRSEKALDYCKSAVGIRPEWNAPHRLLADIALELERPDAAYASLAVLHESRPKHVRILERLVKCARALNLEDESARWTEELKKLAPESSLLNDKHAKVVL
jgi:tetratricopeptide (TPR) repeat protein